MIDKTENVEIYGTMRITSMRITEYRTGIFMHGRKNSKEFGRVLLADSGRPSTVACVAVSSSSTNLAQSNNRAESATDMDQ